MKIALKKSITLLIAAAMTLPTVAFGAVEPQGTASILATQDFEGASEPSEPGQSIYMSAGVGATEANGNKMAVGMSYAGADSMGEAGRVVFQPSIFDGSPQKYLISFDMKLLAQKAIRFYIWDKDSKALGFFIYTSNGKIAFMTSAANPDIALRPTETTSSYGVTDYEVDKWTSIDMMVDTVAGKIKYYANGVHLCDADMPAGVGSYPKYFLSQMNPSSVSEQFLCVDNVSVTVPSQGTFYGTASLDSENISINFSETPVSGNLSQIKVTNTETGVDIAIGTPVLKGKTLTIPYSDGLESATEYCVTIPKEIKSVAGTSLYSNQVYFTAPVTGGVEVPDFENNFDDYSASTTPGFEPPSGWSARTDADVTIAEQPYTNATYDTATSSTVYSSNDMSVSAGLMVNMTGALAADDHTWAVSAAAAPGSNSQSVIKTKLFGTTDVSVVNTRLGGATKYAIEFDYCIPDSGTGGWIISPCFLGTNEGNRLDSNFTASCAGTVTTYVMSVNGSNKTGRPVTATVSSQAAAAGSWHKIKIECDTTARTVKATVDGLSLFYLEMVDETNKDIWKYITGFRVYKSGATSPIYIDNVKLSKTVSPAESLTKVFKTDGVEGGSAVQFAPSVNQPAVLTRNFGTSINTDLTFNFDVKPVVTDALPNKLFVYLPPAAADATGSSVAATSNNSPYLLSVDNGVIKLNGGTARLPVSTSSWYNVSLKVNNDDTISAKAKAQGTDVWTDLGTLAYPELFSGVMARASFEIPKNSAAMAVDNVEVLYEVPAFRINKIRLYDVFGEDFGPLQTTSSMVNRAEICFSEAVAEPNSTINDTNIVISNGVTPCGFDLINYNAETFVATIEFDTFLKKGERYTASILDDAIYAVSGTELKAYTTTFDTTANGIYEYDFSKTVNSSGTEVTGNLTGANTLYAEGYAVNTTDKGETLDITIAAYKTSDEGIEMLDVDEAVVGAGVSSYYAIDKDTNALSVSVSEAGYYAKTFAVNIGDYTAAANAKAKQNGNYKIYAEAAAKKDKKIYIKVSDSHGTSVYKDVRIPAQDGTEIFNIIVPGSTLTDDYTATIYNDADMTIRTASFVYANQADTNTAVQSINDANGDAGLIKTAITTGSNALALGLSGSVQSKMDIDQAVTLLVDWDSKPGNTLTAANATEVLNKLAAITVVDDGKTDNLFADYSDALALDSSEIKNFYKKAYVTESIEKTVTAGLKNGNFVTADSFYDKLNEEFVLAVVAGADGYGNAKEVIEAFKSEIVGTATISDKTYIYIANKSFESFALLGTALTEYEATLEDDPPSYEGGGGGGGGNSSGVSDTVIATDKPIDEDEENNGNSTNVNIFEDIENVSWARKAIVYLAEQGIVAGKSEKLFCPNDNVLREELAKILVGAFLEDAEEVHISFGDVVSSEWYAPFIKKAYGAGVIKGYSAETFGIGDKITREDMAVMIYNSAKKAGMAFENKEFEKFSDDDKISDYAKEAIYTLRNEGVINGVDLSNFAPKASATRAEAAKIIYSLLKF